MRIELKIVHYLMIFTGNNYNNAFIGIFRMSLFADLNLNCSIFWRDRRRAIRELSDAWNWLNFRIFSVVREMRSLIFVDSIRIVVFRDHTFWCHFLNNKARIAINIGTCHTQMSCNHIISIISTRDRCN